MKKEKNFWRIINNNKCRCKGPRKKQAKIKAISQTCKWPLIRSKET